MKQVRVLLLQHEQRLEEGEWARLMHTLPLSLQKKTMRYHRWEDRQSTLLGKLLLLKGLVALGEDARLVHDMAYDDYQRPFIPKGIDFNISHTRGMVVCALLQGGRVGIDVEAVIPVDIPDYKRVFVAEEYRLIQHSLDSTVCFFNLWTRKEAVMKADGRGFHLSPDSFSALANCVEIAGHRWVIKKLTTPENYICHLVLPPETPVQVQYLEMAELLERQQE